MKIKSLTLSGFKSFADPTTVEFHGGITAVVGPNGCGKSNISDALRWVLGEQRASAIRGSRMDEAIFHGTANRKPIHRAEVELRIANEDGILPVPYPEVAIGRTVLRGGESVYELNGQTVRLKDIQDMCRDTGLGANAYSIIESKMIDAILSDRPEERRALFEEAAEIGRYKDRRRTALRRLEQAHGDLQRLDDVIGEVQSKVRSLARQRGRATRYGDLRDRRLTLEVAVAASRLDAIEDRLAEAERALAEARRGQPEQEADLAREETEVEALRLHLLERERERGQLAGRLEIVRSRLEEIERQRLLTDERLTAARRRIEQIAAERREIDTRREAARAEHEAALARSDQRSEELARLRETEAALAERVQALRDERQVAERESADARAELTKLIAELGAAGAEAEGRRERRRARAAERERREEERSEASAVYDRLVESLASAEAEAEAARAERAALEARLEEARQALRTSRSEAAAHRDRAAVLDGELASVSARVGGLAGMLSAGKDLPPIVARLQADRDKVAGVRGVLAEFMDVPPDLTRAVEAQLGSLLFGVVVDDWAAVRRVRHWLSGRDETAGLVLLPLDPGPAGPPSSGALNERVEAHGAGEAWVRALLGGIDVATGDDFEPRAGPWVAQDGSGLDRLGAVRLGQPSGGKGMLRRRAELQELERQRDELASEIAQLRSGLEDLDAEARRQAERVAELDAEHERLTGREREAAATVEATADRLERTRATIGELDARLAELTDAPDAESDEFGGETSDASEGRVADLAERRAEMEARLSDLEGRLLERATVWESERDALQELRVRIARIEADQEAEAARAERAAAALAELDQRSSRLDAELQAHRETIERGSDQLAGSEEELESLFEARAELETEVRERMEDLEERRAELETRESKLRAARTREREASERRHALELEVSELRGRSASIRERIEVEWERAFEELRQEVARPSEGDAEAWADELTEVRQKLSSLGPVNMLAAAEYDEEKERLDFLEAQKDDLESARQDLHDSISRINAAASEAFDTVFREVRQNFRDIFVTLFEGGECDVWLEDPNDPLDSPIEISASPRGKRTQRIHLLSGGERTLTALGLLFAIYLAKPSPFCVMDEVDAPLDESNIGRFTAMLQRFARDTQFLVITHNARTIEAADYIYGVTMQEPGVSTLVALDLKDLPRAAAVG
ncbi:MAG TPA: chromosome segregation protein SMC [Gemmatimonadota bacterium]|nr:chromosome segregation protein SMC [Gemmatimonadota bacterium]